MSQHLDLGPGISFMLYLFNIYFSLLTFIFDIIKMKLS